MSLQNNFIEENYDVLIVGSGVAGLYCALNLSKDLKILIITKKLLRESNTYLAQGGIATAKDDADVITHIEDTLKAGQYENDLEAVTTLINESRENIKNIIDFGVTLDKLQGELIYTKEAAHSQNRIVHFQDQTGKAVVDGLEKALKNYKNITLLEKSTLVDLITDDNKCLGGIIIQKNKTLKINSKVTVLATGGVGGLFKNSTNQRHIKGDGLYIALKHQIKLKDLKYIQFHPTAFYERETSGRRFLISESLRGEGGKLLNINGEPFVDELLPRNMLSEEIFKEMKNSGSEFVYLDMTAINGDYLRTRFPSIYKKCLSRGIDITKDYIPVSPAQHYFMGGIKVDLNARTSMDNLFAVGEIGCTGVHGANRLASNSLLEGLVYSKRAANKINDSISSIDLVPKTYTTDVMTLDQYNSLEEKILINFFKEKVGYIKDELVNN
jgi:L-aspartate oxidase